MYNKLIKKFNIAVLLIALNISLFLPCSVSAAIVDESSVKGWIIEIGGDARAECSIVGDEKASGNSSVKIVNQSPNAPFVFLNLHQNVQGAKENTTYECSFKIKAEEANNFWWGPANYDVRNWYSGTTDWKELKCYYRVTNDVNKLVFRFGSDGPGTVWLDDISVKEVGTYKNLIKNPGFESDEDTGSAAIQQFSDPLAEQNANRTIFQKEMLPYVLGSGRYMPLLYADSIKIDGGLKDWNNQTYVKLPTLKSQIKAFESHNGDDDLSAVVYMAYDDQNIYFAADVTDDKHFTHDTYWQGDSIQLAFGTKELFLIEIGLKHNDDGSSEINCPNEEIRKKINLKTIRNGTKTIYEASINWSALTSEKKDKALMANILVNDNDGEGRKAYFEWTPGIGETKDSTGFVRLDYIDKAADSLSFIEGSGNVVINNKANYMLTISNNSDKAKGIQVVIPNTSYGKIGKHFNIQPNSIMRTNLNFAFGTIGDFNIEAQVTDDSGNTSMIEKTVTVTPDKKYMNDIFEKIKNVKLPKLKTLLDQCKDSGIATDYEEINYNTISDFIGYGQADIRNNLISRSQYVANCLENMYDETEAALNNYLNGKKTPKKAIKLAGEKAEIKGYSFIADTINPDTKKVEKRPVFLNGFGHAKKVRDDINKLDGFGVSLIQNEMGPMHVIVPSQDIKETDNSPLCNKVAGEYGISYNYIKEEIIPLLQNAEKNNIKVDLLLSPHYFPGFLLDKYPELRIKSNMNGLFLGYNIYNPKSMEVIKLFLETLIPCIKDYKALNSLCISNEPVYPTNACFDINDKESYLSVEWAKFLEKNHTTIENLNKAYETDYKSFSDVVMPMEITSSPACYDYIIFNDIMFTKWHKDMADTIRKIAPDIPLHSKMMGAHLTNRRGKESLAWGADPEYFAQFSDISGNDAENLIFNDAVKITDKMKWYDLQTSIKEAPVYNSEDHIIMDGSMQYVPQQVNHWVSDMWQGAIHRRGATAAWIWARNYDRKSVEAGCILERPDVLAAAGKVNLDLNRLALEATALQNAPAKAGILYSITSRLYSPAYIDTVDAVYTSLIFNGKRAGFITETQIDKRLFKDYNVIIVPNAANVDEKTAEGIRAFIENGGKVILVGSDCLTKNEYNEALDSELVKFINDKSVKIPVKLDDNQKNVQDKENLSGLIAAEICDESVKLVDTATGKPVYGADWISTEYNGNLLINICSYEWDGAKKITVLINGKKASAITELISGEAINSEEIELKPYTPLLLEVKY